MCIQLSVQMGSVTDGKIEKLGKYAMNQSESFPATL